MRLQLITPWANSWVPAYHRAFRGWQVQVSQQPQDDGTPILFMWADQTARDFINHAHKRAPWLVVQRRYEAYTSWMSEIDWGKVDHLICVNDFFAAKATAVVQGRCPVSTVYNAVDLEAWPLQPHRHGTQVAMVCFIKPVKNLPLALQIMARLPHDYHLHVAGAIQSVEVMEYLAELAEVMRVRCTFYQQVPHADMPAWLADKDYLLSTSLSEGCPNNVIEAMACGIKPVVHGWPGAREQFGDAVFSHVDEAVRMMTTDDYRSADYRAAVQARFSLKNLQQIRTMLETRCDAPAPSLVLVK